jgi:hypothetical protein
MANQRSQITGFQDHTTDVGPGMSRVENVSFAVQGEIGRRPALGDRVADLDATLLGSLENATDSYLIAKSGATLERYAMTGATSTTSSLSLSTTERGSFANINNRLYYANYTVYAIRDGTSTVAAAGIAAPTTTPAETNSSGTPEAGTRLIRYRFYNATNDTYSDPSPVLEVTFAVPSEFTVRSMDTSSGNITVVEITLANGTVFYKAGTTTGTTYLHTVSDIVLATRDPANAYAAPDGYGHEQPPSGITILVEHRNRLFGAVPSTGWMYWSRGGYPESWRGLDWARQPLQGVADKISGLASFMGDLYVFGRQSVRRMLYTSDPASAMVVTIPTNLGVWNQRCLVQADQKLWGFGREGSWVIDGIQPKHISRPIDRSWRAEIDDSKSDEFHGFYDPKEKVVQWFYVKIGETYPRAAIAYDLMTGQWSIRRTRNTIRASVTFGDSTRNVVPYLADADAGYVWRLNGTFDGLPTTMTDGRITAAAGSTTTVINVNESLPTSPQDLVGAYLYDPEYATEHRITANAAGQVTITPALTDTPQLNQKYYIGSIDVRLVCQWHSGQDLCSKIRPSYLLWEMPSSDTTAYTLQYNIDFSAAPIAISTNLVDDRPNDGVSVIDGTTFQVTNEKGHVNTPIPSDWNSVIRYDVHQIEPYGAVKIMGLTFQVDTGTHVDPRTRE